MDRPKSQNASRAAVLVTVGGILIALVIAPKQPALWQVIVCWFTGGALIVAGFASLSNRPLVSAFAGVLILILAFLWLASHMGQAPRIGPDGKPATPASGLE